MSFTSAFPTKYPLFYKKVISLTFTEAVGLADYGTYSRSIAKTLSERVGLLEVVAKSLSRTISERVGLTDMGLLKSLTRQFTESIGLRETTSKQLPKSFAETLGLYEYWGYVYPYHDPMKALDELIRLLLTAKALGIMVEQLLESPYVIYLIRLATKKMSGES